MSDAHKTTDMPPLIYEPAPCPRCGARTEADAETRCRPERDITGEGTCPAEVATTDGVLLQPTAESVAAMNAWIEDHHNA